MVKNIKFPKTKMLLFITFFCFLQVLNAAPIERIVVDMTHTFDENTINIFHLFKKFQMTVVLNGTYGPNWVQGEEINTATHTGTHMDSPSHLIPGGLNIDQIPASKLIAPAAVINIEDRAAEDREAEVTVEDLRNWERVTGHTLNGTIVLFRFGWSKKWHDRTDYLGTDGNDMAQMKFPGLSPVAAQWLVDNRDINGIGVDTISLDKGSASVEFPVHNILLGRGIFGVENVCNMDKIPIYGAKLHVLPMKIRYASGAATRVIATFPKVIFNH